MNDICMGTCETIGDLNRSLRSPLQTPQKDKNDRILFTLTFHPDNHAVKSIILNNFKLLQDDPETGRIFS